jgi:hypothetical protein
MARTVVLALKFGDARAQAPAGESGPTPKRAIPEASSPSRKPAPRLLFAVLTAPRGCAQRCRRMPPLAVAKRRQICPSRIQ